MKTELSKTFRFDAAHHLPNVPSGHKCAAMHGHGYRVTVVVTGQVDPKTGWVMDFGKINEVVEPLIKQLDHTTLNEIEGMDNPTSEMLAKWFWDRIAPDLPELSAIVVAESDTSSCTIKRS
ncbi:MAG: 6-carboxytetrahydropterin synthase QueD [Phycisphaerae bacterium]|nr:6-carboxytetrahydropterin synthase QueD [Phycisphaerae bacterium]